MNTTAKHRKPGPAATPAGVRQLAIGLLEGRTVMDLVQLAMVTVAVLALLVGWAVGNPSASLLVAAGIDAVALLASQVYCYRWERHQAA